MREASQNFPPKRTRLATRHKPLLDLNIGNYTHLGPDPDALRRATEHRRANVPFAGDATDPDDVPVLNAPAEPRSAGVGGREVHVGVGDLDRCKVILAKPQYPFDLGYGHPIAGTEPEPNQPFLPACRQVKPETMHCKKSTIEDDARIRSEERRRSLREVREPQRGQEFRIGALIRPVPCILDAIDSAYRIASCPGHQSLPGPSLDPRPNHVLGEHRNFESRSGLLPDLGETFSPDSPSFGRAGVVRRYLEIWQHDGDRRQPDDAPYRIRGIPHGQYAPLAPGVRYTLHRDVEDAGPCYLANRPAAEVGEPPFGGGSALAEKRNDGTRNRSP